MSVTSYNASFGLKQDALARNGGPRSHVKKMTQEEYERFLKSPAMMKQAQQEEAVAAKTSRRDKIRMETDPSFQPRDDDWTQPRAFKYDRNIDYYRTLGIDEFETKEGVKKAYRRLSLVYHPDKTQGLDDATKDEYQRIFIQIHNAYLTLGDNPTRRQYDKDRDDLAVLEELYGQIGRKQREQFDAFEALEKLAKNKSKKAATIEVAVAVKLEKMFYGGIKVHKRARRRETFEGFVTDMLGYPVLVPPRCVENTGYTQKHAGDHHVDRQPDNLSFKLRMKPHALVERDGDDLRLKKAIDLHMGALDEPYTSCEVMAVGGRLLLLLGRNPFYGSGSAGECSLHVSVRGEAFGKAREGKLRFAVRYPSERKPGGAAAPSGRCTGQHIVTVTHRDSGGKCCVAVPPSATVADVLEQLVARLALPGLKAEACTLHKKLVHSEGLGPQLPSTAKIAGTAEVFCLGANWMCATLTAEACADFLAEMSQAVERAEGAFLRRRALEGHCEGVGAATDASPPAEVQEVLPYFGFPGTTSGLRDALHAASLHDLELADACRSRLRALAAGEAGGAYSPPPGHRASAAALLHPALRGRQARQDGRSLACHVDLVQLRPPMDLATWPSSRLEFYSNLGQPALAPAAGDQEVRARPMYALVLSCSQGHRRYLEREWTMLRAAFLPLLVQTFWILVRPARALQPKSLDWSFADEVVADEEERAAPKEVVVAQPAKGYMEFVTRYGLGPPWGQASLEFRKWSLYPRRPARRPPAGEGCAGAGGPAAPKASDLPMPWAKLGEVALGQRDWWMARKHFTEAALAAGHEEPDPVERALEAMQSGGGTAAATGSRAVPSLSGKGAPAPNVSGTWHLTPQQEGTSDALSFTLRLAGGASTAIECHLAGGFLSWHGSDGLHFQGKLEHHGWRLTDVRAVDGNGRCKGVYNAVRKEDARAWALAKRADCLEHLGLVKDALQDAQAALRLEPYWAAAWLRVGLLSARLGQATAALDALSKAVELEPGNAAAVHALQRYRWVKADSRTVARAEKIEGNGLFKLEPGAAVARYTKALAALKVPVEGELEVTDEEPVRLIAEILANRSGALAKLRLWEPAESDARRVLALPGREDWTRAQLRLGTALLGMGRLEEAYTLFRRVELVLPEGVPCDHPAKLGRDACLSQAPLWRHPAGQARLARFWQDGRRLKERTRIFSMSDIHFDHPGADDWVSRISNTKFQEDVLIVAGDLGQSLVKVRSGLRNLRCKFRRLFFIPGNEDLWIHTNEEKEIPDSIAKLFCLLQLCDELDVDVFPAAVCKGVFVVPLFSWYNADFDEEDPWPSSFYQCDKHAKWPMDKDNYVWRYMLYLNRRFLEMPYPGEVITFSHFLPRRELPFWEHVIGLVKAVGCPQLDPQIRQVQSRLHIFGHSHHHFSRVLDGVRYVQCPLGYQNDHSQNEPLLCVYDGGLTVRAEAIDA